MATGLRVQGRPGWRWALPAGLVAVVVGGGLVLPTLRASAATDLPDRTAEQLLTDLQTTEVDGWSGTLSYTADLGLPALPEQMGGEHGTGLTSLLSGTHTLRAWAAEPDRFRVALHGSLGEADLVVDGRDVWAWSSDDRTATHLRLPEPPPGHGHGHGHGPGQDDAAAGHRLPALTPEQVTARLLDALEPSTRVSTGPVTSVAGRAAYQLVLEPTAPGSLVGSIRIAVDGTELVPTRVQVFATGSTTPAVELGFTAVSFTVPADDVFAFTPPPGATVEEHDLSALRPRAPVARDADHAHGRGHLRRPEVTMPRPDVTVVGEGWATVLVAGLSGGPGGPGGDGLLGRALVQQLSRDDGGLGAILSTLPEVSGAWGSGHLLTSTLFSVLLTDDGRVLVGAVDGATLQAAATPAATD